MRTSDTNLPMPSACATAGITSVFGGGLLSFGVGVTGVTRLTETGIVVVRDANAPLPAGVVVVIVSVVSLEPIGIFVRSTENVAVVPCAPMTPLEGVTVTYGLSAVIV